MIDAEKFAADSGNLNELYLKMVKQNIASRLRSDSDFDPSRFPNANSSFTNNSNNNNNNNNNDDDDDKTIDEALNQS